MARKRLEEPDVDDGHSQLDVPHPLPANLRESDLDSTAIAYMTAESDPLELSAVTLPVFYRTEDPLTEQPIPFRLERPVVDGFWLDDLTERPPLNFLRRGDLDLDEIEVRRALVSRPRKIDHALSTPTG